MSCQSWAGRRRCMLLLTVAPLCALMATDGRAARNVPAPSGQDEPSICPPPTPARPRPADVLACTGLQLLGLVTQVMQDFSEGVLIVFM